MVRGQGRKIARNGGWDMEGSLAGLRFTLSHQPLYSTAADLPFVQCSKKFSYELRVFDLLHLYKPQKDVPVLGLHLYLLQKPLNDAWFAQCSDSWFDSMDMESRCRSARNDYPYFIGWHNTEFWEIPPPSRNIFMRQCRGCGNITNRPS